MQCQRFGHIWVHCKQPPRCLWCGGDHGHQECPEKENRDSLPKCCNCKAQHSSNYRGCSCAKKELQRRKQQSGSQVPPGRNIASKLVTPGKTYAATAAAAGTIPVATPKDQIGTSVGTAPEKSNTESDMAALITSTADHDRSEDSTHRR
jgi:hypothetical protein